MVNDQLKKRLIGALVLVSLGVIFIPMVLDGGRDDEDALLSDNIPPRPAAEEPVLEIPLSLPAASETAPQEPKVVSRPEPESEPAPARPAADPDVSAPAADSPVEKEPAPPAAAPPAVGAWAVQVGSFGDAGNALALQEKLRAAGFATFVERYPGNNGRMYRVRVGPYMARPEAERAREKLAADQRIDGLVVSHE